MSNRLPAWLYKAVIAIALVLVAWFSSVCLRQKTSNAVETFYYAAKAVSDGTDIYFSHSPDKKCQYVYPPLLAVAFTPLLKVQLMTATRLWFGFNLLATAAALILAAREAAKRFSLPLRPVCILGIAAAGFILAAGEIKTEWATGQTDTLVILGFTAELVLMDKYPVAAGIALGAAANIKYQTLFALPYFIVRRRWKAAASTLASTIAFGILPAAVLGWDRNIQYLKEAFAGLGMFAGVHSDKAAPTVDLTWIRSISITSTMGRLLDLVGGNSAQAFKAGALIALVFLAICWWIYRKQNFTLFSWDRPIAGSVEAAGEITAYEWVGLMVAWLAFGPEVSRRHMYVLLLLNVIAVAVLLAPNFKSSRKPLVIGLILFQLALRLPPSGGHFAHAADVWNAVGGPSWCLLGVYATLLWTGLALARERELAPN